jgi:LPXTG-site transpeptidase (sortase) family protein
VQVDIGNLAVTDVIEITIVTQVNSLGQPPIQNTATLVADPPPAGISPDPMRNNVSAASLQILTPTGNGGLGGVQALPATGFAPNKMTIIPEQTVEQAYSDLGDLWLEIPRLGVKAPVVGVPKSGETWNVDWLWEQAGWLQGSAYPTWQGNSVLTGHVYLPSGEPGPFVNLSKLRWGDTIIVHAFGQRHIYEVRTNHIVLPSDLSPLTHEEKAWLTLLTCKGYDESSDTYKYRIEVRAVLTKVVSE